MDIKWIYEDFEESPGYKIPTNHLEQMAVGVIRSHNQGSTTLSENADVFEEIVSLRVLASKKKYSEPQTLLFRKTRLLIWDDEDFNNVMVFYCESRDAEEPDNYYEVIITASGSSSSKYEKDVFEFDEDDDENFEMGDGP